MAEEEMKKNIDDGEINAEKENTYAGEGNAIDAEKAGGIDSVKENVDVGEVIPKEKPEQDNDKYEILVRNLSLDIKKNHILHDISLSVEKGEAVGLVGQNGCGKTVLMKCILGWFPVFKGEIFVQGKKVPSEEEFPHDVGFIIETPGFIPGMSGYDNLSMLYSLRHKEDKERINEAIEKVGLKDVKNRKVRTYSLGMRQRLGLAQALMEDPGIYILDEPFNGIDREGAAEIRKLLIDEKDKGKTILLSSHNDKDISAICDRMIELDAGKIIKETGL